MIRSISLANFRGFKDHTIDFTSFCLLIGQNNAGKTTLIEALRIASVALQKAPSAKFVMAPDFLAPAITGAVFRFSVDTLDIEHRGMHYNYETDDPAVIKIKYKNNCSLYIGLGPTPSDIFCQMLLPGGKKVMSKAQASSAKFRKVFVMPPVGALLPEETERNKKYLYKHINGYLSYRHIRNQMADMPDEFARFRELLTETWTPKLQIGNIEYGLGEQKNLYGLTIRDGPFVSEMALVGSGLQAWIQTLWFLSRLDGEAVVVLDEPDVYLHADLQKKLTKLLAAKRYKQTIVATHSLEMIADVSPNEIINVAKRTGRSRPLSSSAQTQSVVDALGTNLNIQLSKVASAGKIIFVEGKDHAFLDQIAFKFGSAFYDQFSRIPHFAVGGMNNWPRAAMTAQAFFETSSGKVSSIMFVDRDYKAADYFNEIVAEAIKSRLSFVVWGRKEIENYFLDHDLIYDYIVSRASVVVDKGTVRALVDSVISDLAEHLPDMIADSMQAANRKLALTTAMKLAREYLKAAVDNGSQHADLISGKRALSGISAASQKNWNVQISPMALCRHAQLESVPGELKAAVLDVVG